MIVVSDTSAISALLIIRQGELLQRLFQEVLVPSAVAHELRRAHPTLPDFVREVAVTHVEWVDQLLVELDRGESEAIVLARELQADALLIDERIGRQVAQRAGLHVVGLLGVLAEAKRAGLIASVRPALDALTTEAGFYVSAELRRAVLASVQESDA